MIVISKYEPYEKVVNTLLPMAPGVTQINNQKRYFQMKKKTDNKAIKNSKAKIQEGMRNANEVEGYEPLFKELTKLVPIDRYRYK